MSWQPPHHCYVFTRYGVCNGTLHATVQQAELFPTGTASDSYLLPPTLIPTYLPTYLTAHLPYGYMLPCGYRLPYSYRLQEQEQEQEQLGSAQPAWSRTPTLFT